MTQTSVPAELFSTRRLAEQAFSRAAGAPLSSGNDVQLMIDAAVQFDAWLEAIKSAQHHVLVENYLFSDDRIGRAFRDALSERARAGVSVHVIRDWFGCLGQSGSRFWSPLLAAGGQVRTYNPPRLDSPLGWISRDHRKMLAVDNRVGFLSGVCVSARWLGNPAKGSDAWRDTGVQLRGPVLAELQLAFADVWDDLGPALPDQALADADKIAAAGKMDLRVIATRPQVGGVYRLDQLIASMASKSLWLTDAYFVGLAPYTQALGAAARDGVDVRLLVPGSSDVPVVAAMSRSGYRGLLQAGVRVFEWQGSMLHAKTAVADGRWARVGSSNLNIASWLSNCEIDVAVEDSDFAATMQTQFELDLGHAEEVVLPPRRRLTRADLRRSENHHHRARRGRAAASAMRLASTVGDALANRRVLGVAESSVLLGATAMLSVIAALALLWPWLIAWPLAVFLLWLAISLGLRYRRLRQR
ncbi:MAG: phospholipase D-like domain-containing protein, partial [Xanthomonadales bacterium]|nr:phospholipase D-like domain-containing protein [Xanthomonadales bacterium]